MTTVPPSAGPAASPHDSRGVAGQSFALNGQAGRGPAATRLRKGLGEMIADAIELVELQLSLFRLNAHQAGQKSIWPIAFLSIGGVLALSAIPILLVAIAFVLIEVANLPHWAGFGITFLVTALLGGLAALVAFRQLLSLGKTFDESTTELDRNLRWLKSSLRSDASETVSERQRYDAAQKAQMEANWDR